MKKVIGLIPVGNHNSEIQDRDVLLINGYPLAYYLIQSCKESNVFDELYLCSDKRIFAHMAKVFDVDYHYVKGFEESKLIETFSGNHVVVFNLDYALLEPATIKSFATELIDKGVNIISTRKIGECEIKQKALTGYCNGSGKLNSFELSCLDREWLNLSDKENLFLAEAFLNHKKRRDNFGKFNFNHDIVDIDYNLVKLIKEDGVDQFGEFDSGFIHKAFSKIVEEMGDASSWCYPVIYTMNDQICLICQQPGEGCRRHFHATKDEWWYVVEGSFDWQLDDGTKINVNKGEVILLPAGTVHQIVCTSKTPGIRLAGGARDMDHVYVE